MADEALLRLWSSVCQDFDRARKLLPSKPIEIDGNLDRLDEWLDHNELELALDELEAIGEDNKMPPAYWRELLSAATRMGLRSTKGPPIFRVIQLKNQEAGYRDRARLKALGSSGHPHFFPNFVREAKSSSGPL